MHQQKKYKSISLDEQVEQVQLLKKKLFEKLLEDNETYIKNYAIKRELINFFFIMLAIRTIIWISFTKLRYEIQIKFSSNLYENNKHIYMYDEQVIQSSEQVFMYKICLISMCHLILPAWICYRDNLI